LGSPVITPEGKAFGIVLGEVHSLIVSCAPGRLLDNMDLEVRDQAVEHMPEQTATLSDHQRERRARERSNRAETERRGTYVVPRPRHAFVFSL